MSAQGGNGTVSTSPHPPCLRVIAEYFPPFIVTSKTGVVTGAMVEILNLITKKLNYCYEFVLADPDYHYGTRQPNGSWTGVIGQISRGEADMSGSPFAIDFERVEVLDFSVPFVVDKQVAMYKSPVYQADLTGFVKPYTS
ncbi:Glutamate receptor 2-like 11, partial [Homarus americanus]